MEEGPLGVAVTVDQGSAIKFSRGPLFSQASRWRARDYRRRPEGGGAKIWAFFFVEFE